MARKRCTPRQIIAMLREDEVRLPQGEKVGAICRSLGGSIAWVIDRENFFHGINEPNSGCYLMRANWQLPLPC